MTANSAQTGAPVTDEFYDRYGYAFQMELKRAPAELQEGILRAFLATDAAQTKMTAHDLAEILNETECDTPNSSAWGELGETPDEAMRVGDVSLVFVRGGGLHKDDLLSVSVRDTIAYIHPVQGLVEPVIEARNFQVRASMSVQSTRSDYDIKLSEFVRAAHMSDAFTVAADAATREPHKQALISVTKHWTAAVDQVAQFTREKSAGLRCKLKS